jgi:hypothetical protein
MPLTWLQDYFNAVQFAGGSPNIAVCYLPLMPSGIVRQWINDLVENFIQTWFDMQTAFTENFEGTDVYARVCSCRQCWACKCRGL